MSFGNPRHWCLKSYETWMEIQLNRIGIWMEIRPTWMEFWQNTERSSLFLPFHFIFWGNLFLPPYQRGGGWCQTSDLTNFLAISSKTNFRLKKICPPPPTHTKWFCHFRPFPEGKKGAIYFYPPSKGERGLGVKKVIWHFSHNFRPFHEEICIGWFFLPPFPLWYDDWGDGDEEVIGMMGVTGDEGDEGVQRRRRKRRRRRRRRRRRCHHGGTNKRTTRKYRASQPFEAGRLRDEQKNEWLCSPDYTQYTWKMKSTLSIAIEDEKS